VLLPNSVKAPAFDRLKLSAGVVVAVATLVVNSGERFPALKLVTVAAEVLQDEQEIAPAALMAIGADPLKPDVPTLAMGIPAGITSSKPKMKIVYVLAPTLVDSTKPTTSFVVGKVAPASWQLPATVALACT
jgi:hypothetical protein